MKRLRFGIIGVGNIAKTHADAIANSSNAELVAVSGGHSAKDLAESSGAKYFNSPESLLESESIDAVSLCTPSGARRDYALLAAKHGKHVLAEKPIEVTIERARDMVDACAASRVTLSVIFQSRFKPDCQATYRAMSRRALGSLVLGDAYVKWYRPPEYYQSATWRGTTRLDGGGALMNQAIHTLDLLLWFAGDVKRVQAWTANRLHKNIEVEDTLIAHLEYVQGGLGVVEASTAAFPGTPRRIELHGTAGTIVLKDDVIETWELRDGPAAPSVPLHPRREGGQATHVVADSFWHKLQIEDFVRAIQAGEKPLIDGAEGMRSLNLASAIYESARTGQSIEVDTVS